VGAFALTPGTKPDPYKDDTMSYWETVHEEDFAGFHIKLEITSEDYAPDWDFENEEDRLETLQKIENGSLLWFVAKVSASRKGIELGSDYLGGCCYSSIQEFLQEGYYVDMIDSAIAEARKTLEELAQEA
jgi:hypothetical protein